MLSFSTKIKRFGKLGEKTGWRYIEFSHKQAEQLKPGSRVSFRIRGLLDQHPIKQVALLPMGEGRFILAFNTSMRKGTGKDDGDPIKVQVELDESKYQMSSDFMKCLRDDKRAGDFFKTLPGAHQRYFSKWVDSAKTISTKTKRITMAVIALGSGQGFSEMMRANKSRN